MGRGATGPYGTLAYTFDGVGSRLTSTLGTSTDTYPATSNRLSMINLATGGTRGFTHDGEARPDGLPVKGRQRRTPEQTCEGWAA